MCCLTYILLALLQAGGHWRHTKPFSYILCRLGSENIWRIWTIPARITFILFHKGKKVPQRPCDKAAGSVLSHKKNSTLHVRSGHVELCREVIVSISGSFFARLNFKMPSCHLCPPEFCFCIPILRFGTYSPPCDSLYSYNRCAVQPLPVPITSYYISSTFSDASIHLALSLLILHSYSSISL